MLKLCNNTTYRIIDGNAVVINLDNGEVTTYNKMATLILENLIENGNREKLVEHILSDYDIDEKTVNDDINQFIVDMKQQGVLLEE